MRPRYSIIVPVYNRPDELRELLQSLQAQSRQDFEVLVIEDGSSVSSQPVVGQFPQLAIHYFSKVNEGPGPARNFGADRAQGEFVVFFDSDCILPNDYFEHVDAALEHTAFDAWGGPDRAHPSFTARQQAMAYTMSAALTTGGIRGRKSHVGKFQPRSFNMGVRSAVFRALGGFQWDRLAEDIDLSIRLYQAHARVVLLPEAFVYHKRRTRFVAFFRQVANFGRGRVRIAKKYPGEARLVHWFPTLFSLGLLMLPVVGLLSPVGALAGALGVAVYLLAIAGGALAHSKSWWVACLSIVAALVQFTGYGWGFAAEWCRSLHKT